MRPRISSLLFSLIFLHSLHLTLEEFLPGPTPPSTELETNPSIATIAKVKLQHSVRKIGTKLKKCANCLIVQPQVDGEDEAKEEVKTDEPVEAETERGYLQTGYDYLTGAVDGILRAPYEIFQTVYSKLDPIMYYWGKSYNVLSKTKFDEMSWEQQVKAVVPALTEEIKQDFPKVLQIYGVEIKEGVKYMCAAQGEIVDMKSIQLVSARTETKEDTVILYATYKFGKLSIAYDRLHISYMGVKLKGKLKIPFANNEVTFVGKVPKMSEFLTNIVTQNCLLHIVDFKVNELKFGKILVVARSIVRRYFTQRTIRRYLRDNVDYYKENFETQVLAEINRQYTTSGTWLCKDQELERKVTESIGNCEAPKFTDHFKRICLGEKIPKKGKKNKRQNTKEEKLSVL